MSSTPSSPHKSLDPDDWARFKQAAHDALDETLGLIENIAQQPVWQETPTHVKAAFDTPIPQEPRDLPDIIGEVKQNIFPFLGGNLHPLFMGWVQGAGTPLGIVAEMMAAGMNANCGGRNHVALDVEAQITKWMAKLLDFPDESSGIFVTGTSMANFLAVLVAKTQSLGRNVRQEGLRAPHHPQLMAYTSQDAHVSVVQTMELAGIGSNHIQLIPLDDDGRMDVSALTHQINHDKAAGYCPFMIIGTAGSVNTGAIDDLNTLADIAQRHNLWFHVDGAFGALTALSSKLKPLIKGIERAQSIAFDFHKWMHVPYDAGFLLVRDAQIHRQTFVSSAAYLARAEKGLAARQDWPCDFGPDLSRGFRAFKTWMTFQAFGQTRLAAQIEQTCALAQYLATQLSELPWLEIHTPITLNIVCFTIKENPNLAAKWVSLLQEKGLAAPSLTTLKGRPYIRCALFNHRTNFSDINIFVKQITDLYTELPS